MTMRKGHNPPENPQGPLARRHYVCNSPPKRSTRSTVSLIPPIRKMPTPPFSPTPFYFNSPRISFKHTYTSATTHSSPARTRIHSMPDGRQVSLGVTDILARPGLPHMLRAGSHGHQESTLRREHRRQIRWAMESRNMIIPQR